MKRYFFANSEKASSMISIILALGIVGFGAAKFTQRLVSANKFSASSEKFLDKAILQKAVSYRLACPEQLNSLSNCNGKTPIRLKDQSGETFIKQSGEGRKAGGWNLRAVCKSSGAGNEVFIQYAKLRSGKSVSDNNSSAFIKDYQTKKSLKWKDLFGGSICPNSLDFGNDLSSQCMRKRSASYVNDFVTWCTPDYPKLYSCAQVDAEAPDSPYILSECLDDGQCLAREPTIKELRMGYLKFGPKRKNLGRGLGGDGMYYERVKKMASGKEVNGCWIYDNSHTHRGHRADIMCCKGGE
jgi:hypothetical protein